MSLSNSEEQLMQILWKQKRAFMKDLIQAHEDPKPATTTVATLLKRMQDKNFVDYVQVGRSREYFPLVKKKDYFGKQVNGLIKNFFNNDATQFASFFTETTDLNKEQLEDLRRLIDQQIKKTRLSDGQE
jgi:predicted transcriptional regulator